MGGTTGGRSGRRRRCAEAVTAAWAIIGQQLTSRRLDVFLWAFASWRPRFTFSMASLRSLGGFSGERVRDRILYYFTCNIDNLLIG